MPCGAWLTHPTPRVPRASPSPPRWRAMIGRKTFIARVAEDAMAPPVQGATPTPSSRSGPRQERMLDVTGESSVDWPAVERTEQAMHDPARAAGGDYVQIDPDGPAAHGRIVTVRHGRTRPRDAWCRLWPSRAAGASCRRRGTGRPDMGVTRQRDDAPRRGGVRQASGVRRNAPSLPLWRPEAAEVVFRGMSPGGAIR